jgi:uncharacterized membrane protein YidH (DUF202 family)
MSNFEIYVRMVIVVTVLIGYSVWRWERGMKHERKEDSRNTIAGWEESNHN